MPLPPPETRALLNHYLDSESHQERSTAICGLLAQGLKSDSSLGGFPRTSLNAIRQRIRSIRRRLGVSVSNDMVSLLFSIDMVQCLGVSCLVLYSFIVSIWVPRSQ